METAPHHICVFHMVLSTQRKYFSEQS